MGDQQQRGEGSKSAHASSFLNGMSSQQPQVLRKHWPNSKYVSAEQFPGMIQGLHPAAHRVWQKHLPPILKALDDVDKAFADPATTNQNTDCSYIATARTSNRKGPSTGTATVETPAYEGQALDPQGFQHTRYEVSFNASFQMLQDLLHIQIQIIQVIQIIQRTRVIQVIQVIGAIRIGEGERGNRKRQHFQAMLIDLFIKLRFFDAS